MSQIIASPAPTTIPPRRLEWLDTVSPLVFGLLLALAIRVVLYQPFTIPSPSMEPGLVTGDYIVVAKYPYGWSTASLPFSPPMKPGRLLGRSPARGDVIVFRLPRDPRQTWIKRVIGLPGDTVQIRGGVVHVNDRPIPQTPLPLMRDHDAPERQVLGVREGSADGDSHIIYDAGPGRPGDDTPIYHVPAGHYFMMGDNRDNSLDSRWSAEMGGIGILPEENIIGRAEIVLASWRPGAGLLKPWTWPNLRGDRFLHPIR